MSTRRKMLVGVLVVFDILKFLFVGLLIIGLLLPDPTPEQIAERELAAAEKQAEKDAKAEAKAQKRAEKEAQKLAEIEAEETAKEEARLAHEAEVAAIKAEKEDAESKDVAPAEPVSDVEPIDKLHDDIESEFGEDLVSLKSQKGVETYGVQVEVKYENILGNAPTIQKMKLDLLDTIEMAKESGVPLDSIMFSGKMDLINQYGEVSEEYVLKTTARSEFISNLGDKDAIDHDDLELMLDTYWVHDALLE